MGLGGAEVLLGNICIWLNKKNHKVKVVSLLNPHYSFDKFPNKDLFISITNFEIVSFQSELNLIAGGIKIISESYKDAVLNFKPDVIHSHLFLSELIAHSFHYSSALYFSHAHDNMYQLEPCFFKTSKRRSIIDFIERFWLLNKYKKFNNYFIAISNDTNLYLNRILPKELRKNISLLNNAIDTNTFSHKEKPLDKSLIRIVSIGNLVEKKNHKLLIEIAKQLISNSINFQIDILGHGILLKELTEKVTSFNLNSHIFFRDSVGNVAEFLHQADFYLHTATYEPFGLVLLEAMAAGLPVITLDGKGNRDIIEEGKNGYMIFEEDPKLFADKIIYLINNKVEYYRISEFSKAYAKKYDIDLYVNKLLDIYQNANQSSKN